ncbi:MAG: hypothetical protein SO096_02875 [Prevotella sp.]|nr:hypothetical protein [Bacteroidales bacterium]MDY4706219.1 hypothetical protein [Prevotella sp.]MCI6103023.1 hypothetical protein [Bacteroidales bacterium]MCI7654062.1 hypothetical protein [Bacteroidales bacterium]MDD7704809.1 hypothetical protein [Bacteroidales bacterium]
MATHRGAIAASRSANWRQANNAARHRPNSNAAHPTAHHGKPPQRMFRFMRIGAKKE